MESRRDKLFKGLNFKKDEYLKFLEKYEKLQDEKRKQRYDTLYTVYGLFLDCLEYPNRTRVEHVDRFIGASKTDLREEDLEELRKVRTMVINDFEVAIKTVFPCARELTSPTTQDTISKEANNSVSEGRGNQTNPELINTKTMPEILNDIEKPPLESKKHY